MFKKDFRNLFFATLVLGLVLVANSLLAAWSPPTANPPSGNTLPPITVSNVEQSKIGDLNIGNGLNYWITKLGDSFALKNNAGDIKFVLGQDGKVGIGEENPGDMLAVKANDSKSAIYAEQAGAGYAGYFSGKMRVNGGNLQVSQDYTFLLPEDFSSIGTSNTSVNALEIYDGKLWAGIYKFLSSYDGSSWSAPSNGGFTILSLAVYDNELFRGGSAGTIYWPGDSAFLEGDIYALEVFDGKLWAGMAGGFVRPFNGSNWSAAKDIGGDIRALAVYDGKLWAGMIGGDIKWSVNGANWSSVQDLGFPIYSLETYDGKLWAGMEDGNISSYDGSDWSSTQDIGSSIYSLAEYDGKLWAGMADGDIGSFDGNVWVEAQVSGADSVNALAVYDGKLWAGMTDGLINSIEPIGANSNDKLAVYTSSNNSAIYAEQNGSGYAGYFSGKLATDDELCLGGDCISSWKFDHYIFYEDGTTEFIECSATGIGKPTVYGYAYAKVEDNKLYVKAKLSSRWPNCSCDSGWKLGDTAACSSGASCSDSQTVTAEVDMMSNIYVKVSNQPNCSAEKKW